MELKHYVYCNDSTWPSISTNATGRQGPSSLQSSFSDTLFFNHRSDLGDRHMVRSCKFFDHACREESDLSCLDGTGSQRLQLLCARQIHRDAVGALYASGVKPAQVPTCDESHNRCDMFSSWITDVLNAVGSVDVQLAKLWFAVRRGTRKRLESWLTNRRRCWSIDLAPT